MTGRRDELRILGLRMLPWLLVIGLIAALSYLRLLDLRLAPLRGQARTLLEQGVALTAAELAELSRSALVLGQSTAIGSAAASGDTSAMGTALLTYTRAFPRHAEIAWIDAAEARKHTPWLDASSATSIALTPNDMIADPHLFTHAYAQAEIGRAHV